MVITNLEEKENRKIWVPIRGGNRGGWSLFEWEKVREMPYRDREMYLGVLDKGGKWRKKDWYLHKNHLDSGETLSHQMSEAMRRDQMRMNAALGLNDSEEQDNKLTPAEMQELLKKVKANKEEGVKVEDEAEATGLGFDKMKVQIRAQPNVKGENPHRLDGNFDELEEKYGIKSKKQERDDSRSRSREGRKKKHKKEKHERRNRSISQQKHKKHKHKHRSSSHDRKQKKHKDHKEKKHKHEK